MISVDINTKGNELYMHIEGHASYDEHGKDIVCASVSVLAQSFLLLILELQEQEILKVKKMVVEEGYIDLETKGIGYNAALEMMKLGLKEIAEQYPKEVILNL